MLILTDQPVAEDKPVPFTLPPDATGILPDRMIAAMADAGLILPEYPFVESQIQPASLDLRLGGIAYRVRASFLPGPDTTVAERIDELKLHEIDLSDGAVLETNCVYIVPLLESLALPPNILAAANPKSSTGPAGRVHPRDRRRHAPLRHDRAGLSRPALCRDQSEDVSGPAARRLAAVADPFSHRAPVARW
jgi:hypothetical protein